jgi:uncharacterized protein YraI
MRTLSADPVTGLLLPVDGGVVTQLYGPENTDPEVRSLYRKGYHTGIDFAGVPEGTLVFSPTAGTVTLAEENGGYGLCVVLQRDDGVEMIFGHFSRVSVQRGERVQVGQELGGIGQTGLATGVHVHVEARLLGDDIDPTPYLMAAHVDASVPVRGDERASPSNGRTNGRPNLRTGPGTEHRVIQVLADGARVTVFDTTGEWMRVAVAGAEGYIHQSLIVLDDGVVVPAARTGRITENPNLRSGPGGAYPVLAVLRPGMPVTVLGSENSYLRVRVAGTQGYVYEDYVRLDALDTNDSTPRPGPIHTDGQLAPLAAQLIPDSIISTTNERRAAETWNRYGGLIGALSNELGIDPAVAVAVLTIESGGRGMGLDGRMIIRFENHIFYNYWGKSCPETFWQHFAFDADRTWQGHRWRPSPDADWREFHGDQDAEWRVLEFACSLDDTAAKQSISMGAPQIMGFNYSTLGRTSVQEMFDDFSRDEGAQIRGFFDFVRAGSSDSPRVRALRQQDFLTFAQLYNGTGQAGEYEGLMRGVFDAFRRLTGT